MPIMLRTHKSLTKNGRRIALKILGALKNVKPSPKEHVFKHISFVNGQLQDLYFIGYKMTGDDLFKLFHLTLGEQDMFLLKYTWTVVQNCRRFKNLDSIDAYSKLVKSFIITYKKMVNTRLNASSLALKLPKVASTDKVKKVTNEDFELIFKSVLKSIPMKIVRI